MKLTRWLLLSLSLTVLAGCSVSPTCASGTIGCGGACVEPLVDDLNCGACGNACAVGSACSNGTCCPAGQLACGGSCVNPQTDSNHCGATADCSGPHAGSACGSGAQCNGGACVLSCQPVELDLATPFSTDPTPFASRPGQQAPTAFWASTTAPLPTNTFWENMALGAGENRVDFLPYQIKAVPEGLAVANASPVNTATSISVPDLKQFVLSTYPQPFAGHVVQSMDLFSVTLQYSAPGGTMTAPLVQGMPYVTVDYAGLQPYLIPGTYSISSINGETTAGVVTGTRFELALSDGSTWLVYTSAPTTWNWTSGNMAATASFTGTLRLANVPTPAAAAVLDSHAGAVPRGASLEVSLACDVATVRFAYSVTGTGPLLLAAMPHHLARLVSPTLTTLTFETMSGTLMGVEGNTWTLSIPLSTIQWTAPRALSPAYVAAVSTALASDASFVPDAVTVDTDPYFGGKQLAKLARLALIADELGDTATAATLRARLAPLEAAWLDGTNGNPLVYDTTWGGVVTTNGLASPANDFGQGHYNDHHFHYGYHLYATATLARADPSYAVTHRAGLLAMVRDIANPSAADTAFPRFRMMDFFRSHSWAAGLSEFADGQNQESTSEAVNAWYGLQLLGVALGDSRMSNIGRVLLALELDGAHTYWQVPASSSVYQAPFAQNACVGILFETQALFGTWFASGPEYVYGIQMLPFTPASEALVSSSWIADAWPVMQTAAASAPVGWQGLLYMAHATTDQATAWTEVNTLTGYDDGNSQTNTLWWVASRP